MARLSRLSLGMAVLGAVEALRMSRAPQPTWPATAVCIVGNARTLPLKAVYGSLEQFVHGLGGVGLKDSTAPPDVFAYITLQGAPAKMQQGWNFAAVNATQSEVEAALRPVNPVKLVTTPFAAEVTEENVGSYVRGRDECFSTGFWKGTPGAFLRSLNQLVHWQLCLDLVVAQEESLGKRYGTVIIARPDLTYPDELPDLAAVEKGVFMSYKDWVMAMPRRVAGLLLKEGRARPLTCTVGEPCCRRIGQSEVLWEYLMGVRVDNRNSCNCGPSVAETGNLTQMVQFESPLGGVMIRRPPCAGPKCFG